MNGRPRPGHAHAVAQEARPGLDAGAAAGVGSVLPRPCTAMRSAARSCPWKKETSSPSWRVKYRTGSIVHDAPLPSRAAPQTCMMTSPQSSDACDAHCQQAGGTQPGKPISKYCIEGVPACNRNLGNHDPLVSRKLIHRRQHTSIRIDCVGYPKLG